MKTNNAKVRNVIIPVYFILIVLAVLLVKFFNVFEWINKKPTFTYVAIIFGISMLFFGVYFVSRYFEYDSDGLKVVVCNKGFLLSNYFDYCKKNIEFKKDKLTAFEFYDYIIYKTLVLYIKNEKGNIKKETFNVTLVSKKKLRYIKQSLSKIIKHNRKDKTSQ